MVTCKAAGGAWEHFQALTFSGPDGGTSALEKRQRSIKMKRTSTVELQMELQKVCFAKKMCCKRFFFALIGKDIQKDFTKICNILDCFFPRMSVRKGSLEGT